MIALATATLCRAERVRSAVDTGQFIRHNERAVFRELAGDEGGVLLHLDSGAYHGINVVGTLIWNLIGQGQALDELIEGVRSRLDEAPDTLQADIEAYVQDLVERDLLVLE
jgi:hypothetical protein